MGRSFSTVLLCLLSSITYCQMEICNNAVDDDGDGLIDINDPDCDCPETVPSGLIANPSFEGMSCCPGDEAELECADSWIQASAATSDYWHDCGTFTYPMWLGNSYRTPTPYPDGSGWVGFRDGNTNRPNYKEYVGAALNATMEIGKTYRIDFYLGFTNNTDFGGIDMTFYGHESDMVLPFGQGNDLIGCPLNTPGWTQLEQQYFEGRNEWIQVQIEFTADRPYNTFVLGPGCEIHDEWSNEPYYFVDRLALAEVNEFDVPFAQIIGDLCEPDLTLVAPDGNYTYQWYKDGIALIGEESADIDIPVEESAEGVYLVVFGIGTTCFYSEEFEVKVPDLETLLEPEICEGEVFEAAGQVLSIEDIYEFVLFSAEGCDSVVTIALTVHQDEEVDVPVDICQGESFSIGGDFLTTSGVYPYNLQTTKGCDSLVFVFLTVNERSEAVLEPSICSNETFPFDGEELNSTGEYIFPYTSSAGCDSIITVRLEVFEATDELFQAEICEGEVYRFNGLELAETGIYPASLNSSIGCDSVVTLDLQVRENTIGEAEGAVCDGDPFLYLDQTFTEAGTYDLVTANQVGCDSFISLTVNVISREGGIELPDFLDVSLGETVTISPDYIDPSFTILQWQNSDGQPMDVNDDYTVTILPLSGNTLTLTGTDDDGCQDEDIIELRVSRDIGLYAPNIFSPNGDSSNDNWKITVSKSIASLDLINVYDRWGNLVYKESNIPDANSIQGWDGNINGIKATEGVYVYHATFTALDGKEEVLAGDLTLIR